MCVRVHGLTLHPSHIVNKLSAAVNAEPYTNGSISWIFLCVCLLCYHCTADDAVVLLCLFSLTLSTDAFQSFFHFSTFLFFISFFYSFLFVDYSWAEIFIFTSALPLTASAVSSLHQEARGRKKTNSFSVSNFCGLF